MKKKNYQPSATVKCFHGNCARFTACNTTRICVKENSLSLGVAVGLAQLFGVNTIPGK